VRVRVIAGEIDGSQGPIKLVTPTTLAYVDLEPASTVPLMVDKIQELWLHVMEGALVGVNGYSLGPGSLAILTAGDWISITAAPERTVDVALLGSMPVEGPLLFSGPFVMDTPERLAQAKRDFASGNMGTLGGVPF